MKTILISFIRGYQIFLAPLLRIANGGHGHCRHCPTCSRYAIEAIRELGPLRGCYYAAKRLLHCHPWGTSGFDPVLPKEDQPSATKNDERMI